MIKWKNINWLLVASSFTVAYLIFVVTWIGPREIITFTKTDELNEIGDFLSGVFSPLAFIWLVAAVLTQRQELTDTRGQFAENQKVVDAQLETIKDQSVLLQQQHTLAEETARKTYRLSLFKERFEIYEELGALHFKMTQRGIVEDFSLQLQNIAEKASFVFSDGFYRYLHDVYLQSLEFHDFIGRHSSAFDNQPKYTTRMSSDPEVTKLLNNAESMKLHIIGLIDQKSLKKVMWEEIHVSD